MRNEAGFDGFFYAGGTGGTVTLFSNDATSTTVPDGWTYSINSSSSGSLILAALIMLIPAAMAPFMGFGRSGHTALYGFMCMLITVFGTAVLSLVIAWRTKLPLPPWVWMIILFVAGTIAPIPFLIDEAYETLPDLFRALLMMVSPFQAFVEIVDGRDAPAQLGCTMSAIMALFLFCVLLPVIVRAFAQHHRPSESDAVKPPTPEMLKK